MYDDVNSPYLNSYFLPLYEKVSQKINYQLTVIRLNINDKQKYFIKTRNQITKSNTRVIDISIPSNFKFFWTMVICLRLVRHINTMKRESSNLITVYRSFVPGIVQYLMTFSKQCNRYTVFDTDGLPLSEKKQVNLQNNSRIKMFVAEKIQELSVVNADAVLTRSAETIDFLRLRYKVPQNKEFIKLVNGREVDLFNPSDPNERDKTRLEIGVDKNSPILLFTGSIGEQYMFDDFQNLARHFVVDYPKSKILVATFSSTPYALLCISALEKEIGAALVIKRLEPKEISKYIAACDLAISYRKKIESMKHVAPLKIREYLLCGVPIVYTDSTGDSVKFPLEISMLFEPGVTEPEDIIQWYKNNVEPDREIARLNCRNFGIENFSLDIDVELLVELFSRQVNSK
jgi:hypothetical protein